jgi:hypothetical protein
VLSDTRMATTGKAVGATSISSGLLEGPLGRPAYSGWRIEHFFPPVLFRFSGSLLVTGFVALL